MFLLVVIRSPFAPLSPDALAKHLPFVSSLDKPGASEGLGCFHSRAQRCALDKLKTVNSEHYCILALQVNQQRGVDRLRNTSYLYLFICKLDGTWFRGKFFNQSCSGLFLVFTYLSYWQYKCILVLPRAEHNLLFQKLASFIICK